MAVWAKVKLFWQTMLGSAGSTLTAASTASGYSVDNLYSMLEGRIWKAANATSPQYITLDLGAGNTATADYLAIIGHNLNTAGALVVLQYSATGAWAGEQVAAFSATAPASDGVFLKEFTAPSAARYWRLKIEKVGGGSLLAAPQMSICIWGNKTELDYVTASFDPHKQRAESVVNRSYGGVVAGIHTQYVDRSLSFTINNANSTLYDKVKTWWETHGRSQLFVAWETANNPADVFLMFPGEDFNNPFIQGGIYRDINLSFTGRKA